MSVDGWRYYNHAMIPTCSPHEEPDLTPIKNGQIWKTGGGVPLLVRWTTNFDCGYETNWWYIIKDNDFDINDLSAKKRYEIKKGIKYFEVKLINYNQYINELCLLQETSLKSWPKSYRPTYIKKDFVLEMKNWEHKKVYGCFFRETSELCGYAMLTPRDNMIEFNVLRVNTSFEKYAINAAMVEFILQDNKDFLCNNRYICDGSRNISHETKFQDYLEKYFGFRKAYCTLHIKYRWFVFLLVLCLYPFKDNIAKIKNNKFMHKISSILLMEEIKREKNE